MLSPHAMSLKMIRLGAVAEINPRRLQIDLTDAEMKRIGDVVKRLYSWKMWSSPPKSDIDRILSDNKKEVKDWFKTHGLTTGFLSGAIE